MKTSQAVDIAAPPQAVWAVISDIPNAASVISGIRKIEIIEPAAGPGMVGMERNPRAGLV